MGNEAITKDQIQFINLENVTLKEFEAKGHILVIGGGEEEVTTGYGTRWPEKRQDSAYHI